MRCREYDIHAPPKTPAPHFPARGNSIPEPTLALSRYKVQGLSISMGRHVLALMVPHSNGSPTDYVAKPSHQDARWQRNHIPQIPTHAEFLVLVDNLALNRWYELPSSVG